MEHEIKCKSCGRFLGIAMGTLIATLKCSNSKCKQMNNVKIVSNEADTASLRYRFPEPQHD